jgi:D-3-phosphoglycerate dehydrogenase
MVNAPVVARERGMSVDETRQSHRGIYESYIRLTVVTERQERSVAGTVFSDGKPRIIQIKGINMEAELSEHMLYITNNDRPGFIGRLGTLLGENSINIARMQFGRDREGGDAIALVSIDQPVSPELMHAINEIENVQQVKPLAF